MNHFHFPSNQVEATREFYETYFGFREVRQLGKTHVLADEDRFLLAIDECEHCAPLPGEAHLGFQLSSKDEVRRLHEVLQKEPARSTGPLQEPSPRAMHFYCVDPSGNRLEVGWYDLGVSKLSTNG